ncbi:chitin synthase-domain-containing protein [Halteromyces radiatus]|uniref:chitin synthase-domain-containing protein n=1 Tax=Halteromyces radiatus TaxID=101107 RepID=UPI00221F93E0|nr:chitin synthase-domain-containing protein [Halteromyces radiatus]KAI8078790.1 chitin synthase-domain-containing protein [Halteromyces radiatus]
MVKSSKTQDLVDLTLLESIDEDSITSTLKLRFDNGAIYTKVNDNIIIAVNPNQERQQESLQYVAEYKDTSDKGAALPPHVYQLTNQTYLHMRRTGIDQSILISGETGSGKTFTYRQILQHLVSLSSHKKETKLHSQILNAQVVLEAFGHTKTAYSNNASRYGKFIEVQFNERGRMIGAKTLNYLLEKPRVIRSLSGEQNFHVFYYLLAGASPEERQLLRLDDNSSQYKYLSHTRTPPNPLDSSDHYESLKSAMRSLGLGKRYHARIMQLLAALLHLGNLQFVDDTSAQEAAYVKNTDTLDLIADFLGVDPRALENVLTYKTQMIKKDVTTLILNSEQAGEQRDTLVTALYSLLFSWLVEHINIKLCSDNVHNVIGILDLPGPQTHYTQSNFDNFCINFANERMHYYTLKQIFETDVNDYRMDGLEMPEVPYFSNSGCLALLSRPKHGLIDIANNHSKSSSRAYDANMLDSFIKYNGTHDSFSTRSADSGTLLFSVRHFDGQVTYNPKGFIERNKDVLNPDFVTLIRGGGDVPASYNSFIVDLFSKNVSTESHPNESEAIMNAQQSNKPTRLPSMRRSKSTRKSKNIDDNDEKNNNKEQETTKKVSMVLAQLHSSLDDLSNMLDETMPWFVFCLRANDSSIPNHFDVQRVRSQVRSFGIAQIVSRMHVAFTNSFYHDEFCERYNQTLAAMGVESDRTPRAQCEAAVAIFGWLSSQVSIGNSKIYLNESAWRHLEDGLRSVEKEQQQKQKDEKRIQDNSAALMAGGAAMDLSRQPSADALSTHSFGSGTDLLGGQGDYSQHGDRQALAANAAAAAGLPLPRMGGGGGGMESVYSDDQRSFLSDDEYNNRGRSQYPYYDNGSQFGGSEGFTASEAGNMEMKHMLPPGGAAEVEEPEPEKPSGARRHWVNFVWFMTWWIPSKFLLWCGRMKRSDVRLAWREKLTLVMLIFLLSGAMIWFLVFFGSMICPHQNVFSMNELQQHSDKDNAYVTIRGEVFDLTQFAPHHYPTDVIPTSSILAYGGTDATNLFPIQVSALCEGVTGTVSDYVSFDYNVNLTDTNARYHDFRISSADYRPQWYFDQMMYLRKNYKLGTMGFTPDDVNKQATTPVTINKITTPRSWAILNGSVYDMTPYILGGRSVMTPHGGQAPGNVDTNFMSDTVVNLFRQNAGQDITSQWNAMNLDDATKTRQLVCLRNLFYAGTKDDRNSAKCIFSEYLLLIVTVFLCAVVVFKFLAALQFGTTRDPENHDKFVICQVPCYTEDEDSLRKTIDSISVLKYDDKRKLLFIICDGMIVGGGNDRPTPRIVLDILGVDPDVNPEALSFFSVGEGQKQHNMAKVYSGLYECHGHVVPYIVVVKVGKPSERQKPGNRGKRDSQLVLMRFLNKVHFNAPMAPMELEIYHQIKNVIGVNPSFYEFVLMVDADTEVMPDGLNRMVSVLVHDSKIVGLCGETLLSNEKDTWVTMIQVYEYFISHYLIKAFESLFGTVTCLPGCFSIYRVRTPQKNQPLLIANQVIEDYQINKVDTLHKKNLLFLGEDRYLTTLILKHFPKFKTKFTPDAKCRTNAPDQWSVLVSQRRRWINSTIHNLGELVFLPQLCGFCCFSMRFVVMLDLISTLVQPAIVGYLVYLIYSLATWTGPVPFMSIITIAGVYGLQIIIFMLHRKWEYIIWMIVSILAIPVFSFWIPMYSYWHFDDFSWGNTRVVLGDKGKKLVVVDEGKFDPKSIPMMTWAEYEEGLYMDDQQYDNDDNVSLGSRATMKTGFTQGSYYSYASQQQRGTMLPGQYAPSNQQYMGPPSVYNMSSNQSFYGPTGTPSFMPGSHMSFMSAMPGMPPMGTAAPPYRSQSPFHPPQ